MKLITTILFISLIISCSANRKIKTVNETPPADEILTENIMPACLQKIINTIAVETNGSPQSVTQYLFKQQKVYYMVSPCCDKYNVVYDSACNVLGYPDGGYTGKGDGKMNDFADEATDKKIVWTKN